ncbi:hypothetical protein [Streptomyces sp. SID3343]|uniref:hypothetical protein n=1 Tax=Streptomyces sp. SID3343 TaxID=2690260 RepID=UPI001F3ED5AA|nr:hypothetical protein [Streptomyces sp. SID3343]
MDPTPVAPDPDSHRRADLVPRAPDTIRAVVSADLRRPIDIQADHTRPDACVWALTVIQAWELIGDLQALVARHPAPAMPSQGTS